LSAAVQEYRKSFGLAVDWERKIPSPSEVNEWLRSGGLSPVPTRDIVTFSNEAGTFHYATRTRHIAPLAFAAFFMTITDDEHEVYWQSLSPEDRTAIEKRIAQLARPRR
jgi:hypothetical protein